MKILANSSTFIILFLAACSQSVDSPSDRIPSSRNARVDALISDIVAGRKPEAISKIDSIQTLSGRPLSVKDPAGFVEKLSKCKVTGCRTQPNDKKNEMPFVQWACSDGNFETVLWSWDRNEKIVIGSLDAK